MTTTLAAALGLAMIGQNASLDADFEVALGTVALSTRTARFDSNIMDFFRQAEHRTVLYNALHEHPWRQPFFAENLEAELAAAAPRPQDSISAGMRMLGVQVRRSLVGNPNQALEEASLKEGALAATLQLWKQRGLLSGAVPNLGSVPTEVQSAAALLMGVCEKAIAARRLALIGIQDLPGAYSRLTERPADAMEGAHFEARAAIYDKVDLAYFSAGAFDLAMAVQTAQARLGVVPATQAYHLEIPTQWGSIILSGGTDSRHDENALFVIDTGGNDTYINLPANRTANHPLCVVVDANGNDKYLSDVRLAESPLEKWGPRTEGTSLVGPGGALFGYCFLFDRSGNDVYRSHRQAIASARAGFACLIDMTGDDTYDGYADSLGFAQFGFAMLDDQAGSDRYMGFSQVQGCGQTMGFGYLVDRQGDDSYIANDSVIDFPSPQSAQHNVSMAQGAGNGRRADYVDGHSQAGGVGVLLDQDGNDTYLCGVFGQGVGYWAGVGMLFDRKGRDSYSGQWYVQGASAHFAVGYLQDGEGNDTYTAPMNMAMGAGHDFGTGFLLDRGGDDVYTGPNLSLGAGNANGIGVFLELGGKDAYTSSGVTLGQGAEAPKGSLRMRALTLGVFIDFAGDDTYPGLAPWAKNANRSPNIRDRGPTPAESQLGVFWDR